MRRHRRGEAGVLGSERNERPSPSPAGGRGPFFHRPASSHLSNREDLPPPVESYAAVQPGCERIGLAGVTWHWFRHTHAALLDSVGAPAGTNQALLGHSYPAITHDTNIHSALADVRQAVLGVEKLKFGLKLDQSFDKSRNL